MDAGDDNDDLILRYTCNSKASYTVFNGDTGKESGREGGSSTSPVERARAEASGNRRSVTKPVYDT